jgi:1-acyl-sn-glycerol-3-phosphate acyltransferase
MSVGRVGAQQKLERSDVERRVLEIIGALLEDLGKDRALPVLRHDASLEKDLGLGSLERVELVTRLESEFSVALPESVLAEAESPTDLVDALLVGKAPVMTPGTGTTLSTQSRLAPPSRAGTLVEVLRLRAEAESRRPHIYLQEEGGGESVIRYGDLFREALATAGGLAAQGIGTGDTVALMLPTSRDFFVAFAGVLLAGGTPVPLYPPFRMDRFEEYARRQTTILANAEARLFITVARGASVGHLLRSRVATLRGVTTVDELASHAAPAPRVDVAPDALALIQYTSGSTGDPKGVALTHQNLLANIRAIGQALDIRGTDVGASWLPLYHDMGLIGCWLTPLYFGIPIAILSPIAFLTRPERWLWTIHAKRATLAGAPNFAYELCCRRIRPDAIEGLDLSCWRVASNGAEPVSPDTLERFTSRFAPQGFRPEAMMPMYGLAETSVAIAMPPLDRRPRVEAVSRGAFEKEGRIVPVSGQDRSPLRFVSAGPALPGHEIRIVDGDGGELPERQEGAVQFRGPSTMKGYYNRPEETRAIVAPDGWVDTGDRGFLADGEIFITGRAKDIIIRAGRNIYPHEVEDLAGEVEGVRRGCVTAFGVTDPRQGTEKLIVVAETRIEKEEEKQAIVRLVQERVGQVLGAPADDVLLVPPRTVPKTSSGKLRRSACRDRYLQGDLIEGDSRRFLQIAKLGVLEVGLRVGRFMAGAGRWIYGFYAVGLSITSLVLFWLLVLVVPSRRLITRAARFGSRMYIFLSGCRLRVKGMENLQSLSGTASVLVSNHASYLDPLPLIAALPLDYSFVVKREAMSWPIFGTLIRRLGHLSVERYDPKESVASAEEIGRVLRQGRSVFFFPEGTFTRATGVRPFKLGAFKIAAESGRPVIPLALVGTRRWLRDKTWLPRRSDLEVVVGEPIYPDSSSLSEVVRLRDAAADTIATLAGEPRLDLVVAELPPRE